MLSLPRSGSSAVSKALTELGVTPFSTNISLKSNAWEFNEAGYFEDTGISLLCDQLIRLIGESTTTSFLNPPIFSDISQLQNIETLDTNFAFDITTESLQIPNDFETNLLSYTGNDWDQWGLTRMREGGKWFKCYKETKVDTYIGVKTRIQEVQLLLNAIDGPVFIKDPRLAFALHLFGFTNYKCIWVKRDPEQTLRSMRRHYGPRLFTFNDFTGFNWVSNHFNFQVPGQDFQEYIFNYEHWIKHQTKNRLVFEFQLHRTESSGFQREFEEFVIG